MQKVHDYLSMSEKYMIIYQCSVYQDMGKCMYIKQKTIFSVQLNDSVQSGIWFFSFVKDNKQCTLHIVFLDTGI